MLNNGTKFTKMLLFLLCYLEDSASKREAANSRNDFATNFSDGLDCIT